MSRRAAAPPPIFRRGLAWKAKVAAKVARKRRELQHEDKGLDLRFSNDLGDWATVGEHIDAYHRYNMLVGEADGGEPLGEAAYRELERRCAHAAQDRLFCTWRHRVSGMDCVNVGPFTRCFCGHSYRAHAFYENASKKVACRVPGCRCPCFSYVYHRGGQAVRCMCKHELDNHRIHGRPTRCRARGGGREHVVCKTGCAVFSPTVTCSCGSPAAAHVTVFERRTEREKAGRVARPIWRGMEEGEAPSSAAGSGSGPVSGPVSDPGSAFTGSAASFTSDWALGCTNPRMQRRAGPGGFGRRRRANDADTSVVAVGGRRSGGEASERGGGRRGGERLDRGRAREGGGGSSQGEEQHNSGGANGEDGGSSQGGEEQNSGGANGTEGRWGGDNQRMGQQAAAEAAAARGMAKGVPKGAVSLRAPWRRERRAHHSNYTAEAAVQPRPRRQRSRGGGGEEAGVGSYLPTANAAMAAAAGGLTGFLSLATGMERMEIDPRAAIAVNETGTRRRGDRSFDEVVHDDRRGVTQPRTDMQQSTDMHYTGMPADAQPRADMRQPTDVRHAGTATGTQKGTYVWDHYTHGTQDILDEIDAVAGTREELRDSNRCLVDEIMDIKVGRRAATRRERRDLIDTITLAAAPGQRGYRGQRHPGTLGEVRERERRARTEGGGW